MRCNTPLSGTSRLHVEISKELAEKPRPWSKYSEGSTAYLKSHPEEAEQKAKELEEERRTKLEKEVIVKFTHLEKEITRRSQRA